jgi:DNA-binding transcriptional LysR family regulator
VTVSVRVSDSRGALAALLADACDLALVGARPADRRVRAVPFADDEVLLVGPTSGPCAVRGAATRARLATLPLVLREEGSGTRQSVERLVARLRAGRETPAPIVVGSSEVARRCVLAGAGISFLSRHAVGADLRRGSLRRLAFPGTPARRRFYAVWPSGATLAPAARALRDELLRNHR